MGTGDVLQLICFLHTLISHEDKLKLKRFLVICPLNTVLNWKREIELWTDDLDIPLDVS